MEFLILKHLKSTIKKPNLMFSINRKFYYLFFETMPNILDGSYYHSEKLCIHLI